ncbi:MAG TPA: glycoside hydrolase family 3 C-terminal domain-containing protein [Pyrinomonadaceae bacterium]|jgi:beta-glucosidase|nr:glycoside hydrolase family 3 C-terminal domain-containing protein [Pyrinomonadaceae bacterium]
MPRLLSSALSLVIILNGAAAARQNAPDVERRVEDLLKQLTIEEKIELLAGVDDFFVRPVPRLKLPRLKMADGPNGVRNFGPATAMPSGVAMAATWNPQRVESIGAEIGRDARAKGVHFLLGPGVNIYRAPMNGRNFEYMGEDPFLAARAAVAYVRGVQAQGVTATIKHFAANNSEFDRHNTDSVVDERTLREIYFPAFEAAVREARVGAIMSSYNFLNGEHASQNRHLMTEVAKQDWGFDGVMMSDWGGTYDGVAAVNAGQDLEMPGPRHTNAKNLLPAIEQGKVSVATIDDHVRRILRTAVRFGWYDREQTDLSIPRYNQQGRRVALEAAREAIVLLKNEGGVLPLDRKRVKSVAVVGPNAYPAVPMGGGSGRVEPFAAVSLLEGLSNALAQTANVYHHRGLPTLSELADATSFRTAAEGGEAGIRAEYFDNADLTGTPVITRTERRVNFRRQGGASFPEKTAGDRFTGFFTPKTAGEHDLFVESSGEDGGRFRLFVDDKLVLDNWTTHPAMVNQATLNLDARPHKIVLEHRGRSYWLGGRLALGITGRGGLIDPQARELAARSDAVVIAVGFDHETESEGADRTFRLPPGQDELIKEMLAANKNAVVVITSGGGVGMGEWVERAPAVVQAWYPGQEGGTALAEILLGDVNPSGRLPVTFERRLEDNPANYYPQPGTKRIVYGEGVFVGYRGYEKAGTRPLFPFGHGLSYTTFKYDNLAVKPARGGTFEVTFDVKNTGSRVGGDVAQVYVTPASAPVPRPAKELKGFSKVFLRPGETKRVTVTLDARAFSYYDVNSKSWRAEPGDYGVLVGRSSEQIELRGKATLSP